MNKENINQDQVNLANPIAQSSDGPKKKKPTLIILIIILLVVLVGAGAYYVLSIQSSGDATTAENAVDAGNANSNASDDDQGSVSSINSDTPVSTGEIDNEISGMDKTVDALNDDSDFNDAGLSDSEIGI